VGTGGAVDVAGVVVGVPLGLALGVPRGLVAVVVVGVAGQSASVYRAIDAPAFREPGRLDLDEHLGVGESLLRWDLVGDLVAGQVIRQLGRLGVALFGGSDPVRLGGPPRTQP
jgi:hypothetical protein